MSQNNQKQIPSTASELGARMLELFDDLVKDRISLDKAKSVQNHSAKIMTVYSKQLENDKFIGNKETIPFFAR